jgi:DNA repair protein RecO (recombination protein O)
MSLITTDAIILQTYKYSDTSKILRLITRECGLQSVIAKGALRAKSPYGGVLEPFTEGQASFYAREGRDLQTLGKFELVRSRQSLGEDLMRFGGASLIAELIMRSGIEEADAHLYDAVRSSLDAIQQADRGAAESVVLGEAWALTGQLGFAPALDACISCGRVIEEAEEVTFDYAAGGVRCSACSAGTPGRALPPHARIALLKLIAGESVTLERTGAHWRLLTRFLGHHVLEGGNLKSLAFIAETLEDDA